MAAVAHIPALALAILAAAQPVDCASVYSAHRSPSYAARLVAA